MAARSAGPACSGQVLVYHDLLGMMAHPHYKKVTPKFCRRYADVGTLIQSALAAYAADVRAGAFPSPAFTPYALEGGAAAELEAGLRGAGEGAAADAVAALAAEGEGGGS